MYFTNGDGKKTAFEVVNVLTSSSAMPTDMNNCNLNRIHSRPTDKRDDAARQRWKLLAKALSGSQRFCRTSPNVSVRRFTSFGLIVPNTLENQLDRLDDCWLKYDVCIGDQSLSVEVCLLRQHLTAAELMGFNNTGNICVWPSEEVLAWYLLPHLSLFADKTVLELGGGMTCLAGVMLAKFGEPSHVHLTDGNALSVENVKRIVHRNSLPRTKVSQLDWKDYEKVIDQYDVILSADCLFFDDTRNFLVEALWHCLSPGGVSLIMAPARGATLHAFMQSARLRGFLCSLHPRYCDVVWARHLHFQRSCPEYDEDLHYPLLLLLTKPHSP